MGLGAVLADAKSGLYSGCDRGSAFQSTSDDDVAAYGAELDGMSFSEKGGHYVGVAAGEILNIATFGILAYRKFYALPGDVGDVDRVASGDLETEVSGGVSESGSVNNYEVDADSSDNYEKDIVDENGNICGPNGDFYPSQEKYTKAVADNVNLVNDVGDGDDKDSNGRRIYFANGKNARRDRRGSKLEESVEVAVGADIEDGTFYDESGDSDDEAGEEMNLDDIKKYEAEVVDEISKVYEDVRSGKKDMVKYFGELDVKKAERKAEAGKYVEGVRVDMEAAEDKAVKIEVARQYYKDWDKAIGEDKWFNNDRKKAAQKEEDDVKGRALQEAYWDKRRETVGKQEFSLNEKIEGFVGTSLSNVYKRVNKLYLSNHDVWYVKGMDSEKNKHPPGEKRPATIKEKTEFIREIKGLREARQYNVMKPRVKNKPVIVKTRAKARNKKLGSLASQLTIGS